MINEKQTFNELISELKDYVAIFQSVCLYVMRGLDGNVSQLKVVPFEQVRRSNEGTFLINPTFWR